MKTFLTTYALRVDRTNLKCSEPYPEAFRESVQVAKLVRDLVEPDEREHFGVFLLDTRNRIKGAHEISVGTLTASLVHPREDFRLAIYAGAAAVIFYHNHPSGDPAPSREDADLTRRLAEGGKLLGIRVLDHVIIGDGNGSNHYSFADSGEMF